MAFDLAESAFVSADPHLNERSGSKDADIIGIIERGPLLQNLRLYKHLRRNLHSAGTGRRTLIFIKDRETIITSYL
jgi:hypothetical protein